MSYVYGFCYVALAFLLLLGADHQAKVLKIGCSGITEQGIFPKVHH